MAVSDDLWARDNCSCPRCLHPTSRERLVMVIEPGDGPHAPPLPARADPAAVERVPFGPTVARVPYADLDTAAGMDAWLTTLLAEGAVVITGAPCGEGEVVRVAERVGFARPTNFGLLFDVVSTPSPTSNAYTAFGLALHTDLPYWDPPPEFQLLHTLANDATGGDSTLADGIAVARQLAADDPAAFELLTRWPVPFRYLDADTEHHLAWPVIEVSDDGQQIVGIRFNNGVRATDHRAAGPDGERFYRAYLELWRRFNAAEVAFRLEAGDVLCFDNRRMLHGRTAFDPTSGRRHLQGCYLDRTMVLSRLRTLRRQADYRTL